MSYIEVEYCQGCSTHAWCTNHDEGKYSNLFRQIEHSLCELPIQVVAVDQPRLGAFEVRFRSSRGSLLLASKLRSGKWPSVVALYRKVAQLLTSADWSLSLFARRNEVLGLDVTSSFPFLVKAVLADSLGAVYGIQQGDQLVSIGNSDQEISHLFNIRVVLAALKTRPVVVRFRRVGEILCPRLDAPIDPPKSSPVPPLSLSQSFTPAHTTLKTSNDAQMTNDAMKTPPALPTPAGPAAEGPSTPREANDQYIRANEEEYGDDFDN